MTIKIPRARLGLAVLAIAMLLSGCNGTDGPSVEASQAPATAPREATPQDSPVPAAPEPSVAQTEPAAAPTLPTVKATHKGTVNVDGISLEAVTAACKGTPQQLFWMASGHEAKYKSNELEYTVTGHTIEFTGLDGTQLQYLAVVLPGGSGTFQMVPPAESGTWSFTADGGGNFLSVTIFACTPLTPA